MKKKVQVGQTKWESALEQLCNTGSGMVIAYMCMQHILAPYLGIHITPRENTIVTIVLTVVSVARGYIWRRIFNRKMWIIWKSWFVNVLKKQPRVVKS